MEEAASSETESSEESIRLSELSFFIDDDWKKAL